MYVNSISSRENLLSLGHLLKNSPNRVNVNLEDIFLNQLYQRLCCTEGQPRDAATISRIIDGSAVEAYRDCANYLRDLPKDMFKINFAQIVSFYQDRNIAAHNLDTGVEIKVAEALRILVNGDAALEEFPAVRDWFLKALSNGEKFLNDALSAATVLSITRGYWGNIIGILGTRLSEINSFPHYSDYDSYFPADKIPQGVTDDNLLNAYISWRGENFDGVCEYLVAALGNEQDNFCRERISEWLAEAEQKHLAKLISDARISHDATLIEDCLRQFEDKSHYAGDCFKVSEMYRELGENEQWEKYLRIAADLEEPAAMCQLMKELYPSDEGLELAEKLSGMNTSPPIRGEAYYQRYQYTEDRKFLREACRCGFPREAVEAYTSSELSYHEELFPADFDKAGNCILNVAEENPISQILSKTKPDSWQVHFKPKQAELIETAKSFDSGGILMCLLAKDDEAQNLKDFLRLLESLRNSTLSGGAIFIIRGNEELTSPVDTALQQWYGANRPTIRVQILDEEKLIAQELLARHPLCYPAWKSGNPDAISRLVIVGEGSSVPWIIREASWLMTCAPKFKIFLISPNASSILEDLKSRFSIPAAVVQPVNASENQLDKKIDDGVIGDNDAIYFIVDTGTSDLHNMAVAKRIREIYIRAWIRNGNAQEPVDAPVAFRCESPDVSFISRRSIVFSELHGESWFNSYKLIPYGDIVQRYSWKNLVSSDLDRLGVCVHMSYCDTQRESSYQTAFESYARMTYNRDSSVSVAVSLPYRLYLMSRLDSKIIPANWDITDGDFFFSKESRQQFIARDAVSKLSEFCKLIEILSRALQRVQERLETWRVGEGEAHWQACIVAFKDNLDTALENMTADVDGVVNCEKFNTAIRELEGFIRADVRENAPIDVAQFEDIRNELSAKVDAAQTEYLPTLRKKIDEIFAWEHKRWSEFMLRRGWKSATAAEATKYIQAGSRRQQCYIARMHPCILPYRNLDRLAKDLEPALGVLKKFKQNDIDSVNNTGRLLAESWLDENHGAGEIVRDLYGVRKY